MTQDAKIMLVVVVPSAVFDNYKGCFPWSDD
jgi:hypothetical protein